MDERRLPADTIRVHLHTGYRGITGELSERMRSGTPVSIFGLECKVVMITHFPIGDENLKGTCVVELQAF